MNFQFSMIAFFFKLVPFGLVPFSISAFWQTVKLLNSQNFFFQGLPIEGWGKKTKLKLLWTFFSSLNFQFLLFFLLKQSSTVCE